MHFFPALLVNTRHLQVAEGVAFLHRNPTGHLNFAARSTEPCALHIAPAPTASFSKLVGQFARVGKSTRRMSRTFPRERSNLLRVADGFSAPVDRFSRAGQSLFLRGIGYPAHGICGRQTEQRKSKGWQDRLSPVFGDVAARLACCLPQSHTYHHRFITAPGGLKDKPDWGYQGSELPPYRACCASAPRPPRNICHARCERVCRHQPRPARSAVASSSRWAKTFPNNLSTCPLASA